MGENGKFDQKWQFKKEKNQHITAYSTLNIIYCKIVDTLHFWLPYETEKVLVLIGEETYQHNNKQTIYKKIYNRKENKYNIENL